MITQYFGTVHHWLPMVHERRLRARLHDPGDVKNLTILIHAMVVATIRHINYTMFGLSSEDMERQVRMSIDVIMLNAPNGRLFPCMPSLA